MAVGTACIARAVGTACIARPALACKAEKKKHKAHRSLSNWSENKFARLLFAFSTGERKVVRKPECSGCAFRLPRRLPQPSSRTAAARGWLEHLLQEGGVAGAEDAGVHDDTASLRRKRRVHVPQVLRNRKQEAGSNSQLRLQLIPWHGRCLQRRRSAAPKAPVHVHQVLRSKSKVSLSSFVCARNSCRVPAGDCSAESCSSMLTGESGQCRTHLRAYVA